MTAVVIEEEILNLLDFNFAPPCEWPLSGKWDGNCDVTATWKIVKACCGRTYLYCEPHLVSRFTCKILWCADCGTEFTIPRDAYAIVERL